MAHSCDTIVINCMDYRLQKYLCDWTKTALKDKTFDLVSYAGSSKDLNTILAQIDISVRLHHTKEVHIIHHENCGAYGEESTYERHVDDLHKAKSAISKKYPQLKIALYYLSLGGNFETIN